VCSLGQISFGKPEYSRINGLVQKLKPKRTLDISNPSRLRMIPPASNLFLNPHSALVFRRTLCLSVIKNRSAAIGGLPLGKYVNAGRHILRRDVRTSSQRVVLTLSSLHGHSPLPSSPEKVALLRMTPIRLQTRGPVMTDRLRLECPPATCTAHAASNYIT
jgi:hypothetical protein